MSGKFVAPRYNATAFSCPHCGTLSPQHYGLVNYKNRHTGTGASAKSMAATVCDTCGRVALWMSKTTRTPGGSAHTVWTMVWPDITSAPEPSEDLPDEVRSDYDEA